MRLRVCVLAVSLGLSAVRIASAQQPEILHAQLTTHAANHGLGSELDAIERSGGPVWVGYSIPVMDHFQSGWNSDWVAYLEREEHSGSYSNATSNDAQDHAVVLLKVVGGAVDKLRIESPNRQLDAGGLQFVWLTEVKPLDSIAMLKGVAMADESKQIRDSAVFLIALHRAPEATSTLVALAAPANDLELREKAAFWLANQRGKEGFAAIQRLAREDADPRFREKLTFDLTLSKEPAALEELIRMAHADASPQVRKQAQFWMATRGGKQVAGDLRSSTANDPDKQVRRSAVFGLSRLPGDEAATQLMEVAGSSKDPEVRKQAVFWLGQSSDPRALEYLTKLLQLNSTRQ